MKHVPYIAHRGMAVAQMHRRGRWNDAFGRARLAADDEIVAAQIELLEGQRHQWKIAFVTSRCTRQLVDEGSRNPMRSNFLGDSLRNINVRKYVSLWVHVAQSFQHLLAAAHANEPIVHY